MTATVVAPTPPFAPTNANTWPVAAGVIGRCAFSLEMAAPISVTLTGSVTTSFTPARIASSSSAGSIRRRHDDHAGRRMLPLEQRQCRGKMGLVAQIEDENIGLRRAGLRQRRELRAGKCR